MKFKCNGTEYTIEEVEYIELSEELIGQTRYQEKKILLKKLDEDLMIKTLKHELTHVWLYEYGHPQNDDENFTYENVCEIVACSNDFINKVVGEYLLPKRVEEAKKMIGEANQYGELLCTDKGIKAGK